MSKIERRNPQTSFPNRTLNVQNQRNTGASQEANSTAPTESVVHPEDVNQAHGFDCEHRTSTHTHTHSAPLSAGRTLQASGVNSLLQLQMQSSDGSTPTKLLEDPRKTTQGAAQRLYDAMKGVGTNEKEIFRVLRDRTFEEIELIRDDFQAKFGDSLDHAIEAELSGKQERKAKVLLQGDTISSAHRGAKMLRFAMEGMGTDEKGVLDSLYGTSDQERQAITEEYRQQTGRSLEKDLRSEHSGTDEIMAMAMYKRGNIAETDLLRAAMKGIGTDEAAIFRTLEGKDKEQLVEIQEDYQNFYDRELPRDLKKELSGGDLLKAEALLEKGYISGADKLHIAMHGWGTDTKTVFSVFEGKTEEERQTIISEYNTEYGDLNAALKDELTETQFSEVQSLMEHGELSIAEQLNRAMRGFGSDEEAILNTLNGLDTETLNTAREEYQQRYDRDLDKHIRSELNGRDQEKADILLKNGSFDLSEKIHYATIGRKVDKEALFEALEQATPEERTQLEQTFKQKYNRSISKHLASKLKGAEETKALFLLEGPMTLEQKLEVATVGIGTRENEIFQAIEDATPEERMALTQNDEVMSQLKKDLNDRDMERVDILLERGHLTRSEKLHFAMEGRGTDEDLVFEALANLSFDERAKLQEDYRIEYGRELIDDLRSELDKREMWKAEDALAGPPATMRERVDRAEVRMSRERDSGTLAANVSDNIMDLLTATGKNIDQEFRELRHIYKEAREGNISVDSANEQLTVKEAGLDELTQQYQEKKDSTASTVSNIATMSVAAAATVATGGMATLPAAAVVAASAGTAKVVSSQLVTGNSYDLTGLQGAQDFLVGAGEGLALVAMGKAGEALYSTLGKQALLAQGHEVTKEGLLALGRKALEGTGKTITKELVEKAAQDAVTQAGKEFLKKSLLHKIGGAALTGAVKGSTFYGVKTAIETTVDDATWESEFSEAIVKILKETGSSAASGAKNFAVAMSTLQVGAQVNEAMMSQIKRTIGEQLADKAGTAFSAEELTQAGMEALGGGADSLAADVIQEAGREKLLTDLGSQFLDKNMVGESVEIFAGNMLKRATAAYTKNSLESLNKHEIWRDGMGEALEHLWRSSNETAIKGTAQWGGKDVAMEFVRRTGAVNSGGPSEALLSSVLWRSLGATINQ